MPVTIERFRETLLAVRKAKKMSRKALAERSGLSVTTIQSAEKGPDVTQIDTAIKLIEGAGMTLSEFFRLAEPPSLDELMATAELQSSASRNLPKDEVKGTVEPAYAPHDANSLLEGHIGAHRPVLTSHVGSKFLAGLLADLGTRLHVAALQLDEQDRAVERADHHARPSRPVRVRTRRKSR